MKANTGMVLPTVVYTWRGLVAYSATPCLLLGPAAPQIILRTLRTLIGLSSAHAQQPVNVQSLKSADKTNLEKNAVVTVKPHNFEKPG